MKEESDKSLNRYKRRFLSAKQLIEREKNIRNKLDRRNRQEQDMRNFQEKISDEIKGLAEESERRYLKNYPEEDPDSYLMNYPEDDDEGEVEVVAYDEYARYSSSDEEDGQDTTETPEPDRGKSDEEPKQSPEGQAAQDEVRQDTTETPEPDRGKSDKEFEKWKQTPEGLRAQKKVRQDTTETLEPGSGKSDKEFTEDEKLKMTYKQTSSKHPCYNNILARRARNNFDKEKLKTWATTQLKEYDIDFHSLVGLLLNSDVRDKNNERICTWADANKHLRETGQKRKKGGSKKKKLSKRNRKIKSKKIKSNKRKSKKIKSKKHRKNKS